MKNNIFIIMILTMFGCATVNQSEVDIIQRGSEAEKIGDRSNEEYQLDKAKLTKELLKDFEPLALEKFTEFFEQIKIATNPDYNNSFKQVAVSALEESILNEGQIKEEVLSLKTQLSIFLELYSSESIFLEKLENVVFKKPFQLDKNNNYVGVIGFYMTNRKENRKVDVFLTRIVKLFGNEKKEVWEVKFSLF